jgi:hypothetical protein
VGRRHARRHDCRGHESCQHHSSSSCLPIASPSRYPSPALLLLQCCCGSAVRSTVIVFILPSLLPLLCESRNILTNLKKLSYRVGVSRASVLRCCRKDSWSRTKSVEQNWIFKELGTRLPLNRAVNSATNNILLAMTGRAANSQWSEAISQFNSLV